MARTATLVVMLHPSSHGAMFVVMASAIRAGTGHQGGPAHTNSGDDPLLAPAVPQPCARARGACANCTLGVRRGVKDRRRAGVLPHCLTILRVLFGGVCRFKDGIEPLNPQAGEGFGVRAAGSPRLHPARKVGVTRRQSTPSPAMPGPCGTARRVVGRDWKAHLLSWKEKRRKQTLG